MHTVLNVAQFCTCVVKPALNTLGAWDPVMNTPVAEDLLMGTAVQESRLTYLTQLNNGPGLGIFQIEATTHDDVWKNFLAYRTDLADIVNTLAAGGHGTAEQLPWNMGYATAIARLVFWRAPEALPDESGGAGAMGAYWKQYYNTPSGGGTSQQWVDNYNTYVV